MNISPSILFFSPEINEYLLKIFPFLEKFDPYENVFHLVIYFFKTHSFFII